MGATRNFNPAIDKKLTCTCGLASCDKRTVSQATLDRLQSMRDDLGASIIITSGARCPNHPNELGRKGTDHQSCDAVDIAISNEQQLTKILVLAGRYGATRCAYDLKRGFVHISFVDTERRDVPTWSY